MYILCVCVLFRSFSFNSHKDTHRASLQWPQNENSVLFLLFSSMFELTSIFLACSRRHYVSFQHNFQLDYGIETMFVSVRCVRCVRLRRAQQNFDAQFEHEIIHSDCYMCTWAAEVHTIIGQPNTLTHTSLPKLIRNGRQLMIRWSQQRIPIVNYRFIPFRLFFFVAFVFIVFYFLIFYFYFWFCFERNSQAKLI